MDLPLAVSADFECDFAFAQQTDERVGKQKMKHPFNESAIVCTQGRHFKRAPLI